MAGPPVAATSSFQQTPQDMTSNEQWVTRRQLKDVLGWAHRPTMNFSLTLLIECFLFLGAIALAAVLWAVKHTANGCEDEGGFHPEPPDRQAES
jgi:hypothetical protein